MSRRRRIRVASAAARQIADICDWWRAYRPAAPTLFLGELDLAYELIRYQPDVGQRVTGAGSKRIRRVGLGRSGYHVYYQPSEDGAAIEVLAVWHARRGRGPDLY